MIYHAFQIELYLLELTYNWCQSKLALSYHNVIVSDRLKLFYDIFERVKSGVGWRQFHG